jgi:hypothetical protein
MPRLREVHLPTGMTITLGCAWPGGRGAGDAGTEEGRAAGMRAQAEPRAGAEDVEPARAQDDMGAVGGQADP